MTIDAPMDDKDERKSRRPLPASTSPPIQRPNTPVPSSAEGMGIPPQQFYGTRRPKTPGPPVNPPSSPSYSFSTPNNDAHPLVAPALPNRPPLVGSSHTTVHVDPPSYTPYREPELVEDTTAMDAEIPPLLPNDDSTAWPTHGWDNSDWPSTSLTGWGLDSKSNVAIERSIVEENNWWKSDTFDRPGPGYLPPAVEMLLHDQDHTIFSVTASPPPSTREPSAILADRSHPTPSEEEVRTAIPHPNAYYCPKDNGWTLLSWKSSNMQPPLSNKAQTIYKLPNPDIKYRHSCLDDSMNRTHHFHKYAEAVDSSQLTPPYQFTDAAVKERNRKTSIIDADIDVTNMQVDEIEEATEETGFVLDLYVCCQCMTYCVVSPVIPGVVANTTWTSYTDDRRQNPGPGKTGHISVCLSVEKILGVIENLLWRCQTRSLKVGGSFISVIGFNDAVVSIFESLGFTLSDSADHKLFTPPTVDLTGQGRMARAKLLRAWVEMSAWLDDFKRRYASALKGLSSGFISSVNLVNAREMCQNGIGSHPDQIAREDHNELARLALDTLDPKFWDDMGLTVMTASAEMVEFAYYAQCRCDPGNTPKYFTHLSNLVTAMTGVCPPNLEELLVTERSRDRFTLDDVQKAAKTLGFPEVLRVDYHREETPDEFIENAWKHCVKEAWKTANDSAQKAANDALRILAQERGSQYLMDCWEQAKNFMMNPERAYQLMEVSSDVEESMLAVVYTMRLEEQPLQVDKWRSALSAIAEARDSDRLRLLAQNGYDPGEITVATRPDWPRGLNQLGNTCYLNSLLQYFYTIKDIREAVKQGGKYVDDDEKLTDDDLKRHRVGGRLVTRREILRSKKFVNQLAQLFFALEHETQPAVTPTLDLAKLALVTSKDEEEDEIEQGGSDSSNDTDATLVDDGPVRIPAVDINAVSPRSQKSPSPSVSPGSILGKRGRGGARQSGAMEIDTPPYTPPSPAPSEDTPPPLVPVDYNEASGSGSRADTDVDMMVVPSSNNPPPLPARKKSMTLSDSGMMFGRQHDVAECMDNCMFQIETALLKFDGVSDSQSETDKTSVVKQLFYGKIRQNVLAQDENLEKEDIFSHLPVNVGENGFDLYDGLGQYFYDLVDYKNQKAPMQLSLISLPPLLHIQLQRVKFDRELLQSWKSQAYVKFDETIYMDRYMEDADPKKREESRVIEDELNSCRERMSALTGGKNLSFVTALGNTREFLSKQADYFPDVDDEMIALMNEEEALLKTEMEDLRLRITTLKERLEQTWEDEKNYPYELTSVFIHRGSSPTFGHYFFYSRHLPDHPDEWFKYNDSEVSSIPKAEVFADTTGSTANPYLLVFARKGSAVVDTVKRFNPESVID